MLECEGQKRSQKERGLLWPLGVDAMAAYRDRGAAVERLSNNRDTGKLRLSMIDLIDPLTVLGGHCLGVSEIALP